VSKKCNIIITQTGARHNYRVPYIFEQSKMLSRFITDIWIEKKWIKLIQHLPLFIKSRKDIKKFCGRYRHGIPRYKIKHYNMLGFEYVMRMRNCKSLNERALTNVWFLKRFGEAVVANDIKNTDSDIIYCIKEGVEIFEAASEKIRVLEQVDCPELYWRIYSEELESWQGWAKELQPKIRNKLIERDIYSQKYADYIIAPSMFTKKYLMSRGIDESKIFIVPFGYDLVKKIYSPKKLTSDRKLRILYVGSINLMKGIPYLFEAINSLNPNTIEVCLVGPVEMSKEIIANYFNKYHFAGKIPRLEVDKYYDWADILIFPTLCDSFGMVVLEALSHGIPVITTPNSGCIIKDGKEGFIVPIRNSEALSDRINKFICNPSLVEEMSSKALQLSRKYSLEKYSQKLINTLLTIYHRERKY